MQPSLTPAATRLAEQLHTGGHKTAQAGHPFHVAGLGSGFYFAYEQLRNVAEYREHHLLLRSAIGRFLVRHVNLGDYEPTAGELVTELTQAGYLKNDSVSLHTVSEIDRVLAGYALMFQTLHATRNISPGRTAQWFFDIASVHVEGLLTQDLKNPLIMRFAYEHYHDAINREATVPPDTDDQYYRIALFCAVQRALFKSDLPTTRYYCITSSFPDLVHTPIEHFIQLNYLVDELYQSPLTNKLLRLINRFGAPMRILREVLLGTNDVQALFADRNRTLARVREMCNYQYLMTKQNLGKRIARSLLFVLITKTLLGVSLEIPYDLATAGEIDWLPLAINIVFPLVYLALIGSRIHVPGAQNTDIIAGYIDRMLFSDSGPPIVYELRKRVTKRSLTTTFNVIYALVFLASFALLLWALNRLGFNIVSGAIFFVFLCGVSFLGFRLRQTANELQMLDEHHGLLQTLADLMSAPFVRVGHWLSDKYARANFVTGLLDLAIEMPFKTSLRLLRHWMGFLRDKQEEL